MLHIFIVFLLSHLLGDFIFQTDKMAKHKGIHFKSEKKQKKFKYLFLHVLVHAIILILVLLIVSFLKTEYLLATKYDLICMGILVIISHALIDFFKFLFTKKISELSVFLLDQLLHIVCIYLIIFFVSNKNLKSFFNFLDADIYINYDLIILDKILLILIVNLIGIFFASYFIDLYLKRKSLASIILDQNIEFKETTYFSNLKKESIRKKDSLKIEKKGFIRFRDDSPFSFGRSIGLVERLLIILLISTNNYATIAIVIGLKTLTRFKMIEENKDFGEYYLMGNLLSLVFSVLSGTLIKLIWTL